MKKVLIIEDEYDDFVSIKDLVQRSGFNCPQNYTEDDFKPNIRASFINNLRGSLQNSFVDALQRNEHENAIESIKNEFNLYCQSEDQPIYLIDYILEGADGKNNSKNGIRFIESILPQIHPNRQIPVLIITGAHHSPLKQVEDFVRKGDDPRMYSHCTKPDSDRWDTVRDEIVRFINGTYPEELPQRRARDEYE
jgi:CheY-like chemotaxis protein